MASSSFFIDDQEIKEYNMIIKALQYLKKELTDMINDNDFERNEKNYTELLKMIDRRANYDYDHFLEPYKSIIIELDQEITGLCKKFLGIIDP